MMATYSHKEPTVSMPVSVAKELMDAYDAWEGSIPWDLDEGETQREYMERHARLRKRIDRLHNQAEEAQ